MLAGANHNIVQSLIYPGGFLSPLEVGDDEAKPRRDPEDRRPLDENGEPK